MPSSRPNHQPAIAVQPAPTPPSSVSIGKKPMNYAPTQPQAQQQQSPGQQQQPPKSARAASKAPVYTQQQPQQPQAQQQQTRHPSPPTSNTGAVGKNKNKARVQGGGVVQNNGASGPTAAQKGKGPANPNTAKIWNTNSAEERERIKEFWLGLGEQERRNLVKIEKDTVLRKMKEQQKHSCSCAVCGRKRNAIEEELEVLYDAYYEELEQYANHQQRYVSSGGTIPPPPGPGPFPGSVEYDKNGAPIAPATLALNHKQRSKSGKVPQQRAIPQTMSPAITNGRNPPHTHPHPQSKESEFEEDEGEEDDYPDGYEEEEEEDEEEGEEEEEEEEEEEDEEEEEEEEEEEDIQPQPPANQKYVNGRDPRAPTAQRTDLQTPAGGRRNAVLPKGRDTGYPGLKSGPGNILTVADDLLKNDGQKFLEMMEQLAERRMQREEETIGDVEEESEEESDEERDGSEGDDEDAGASDEDDEDDEDDDEEEMMTEEQKMEEGKRMFSIFAARMFEQRVLQAYREKIAQERQLQLLRELDEEDKSSRDREAKKQSQNQKKKDKRRQQKQAKEEEKAAKTAEKAAEEAAIKARQQAQEEESRRKREDERLRREAAKKAAEEEKARKEEEKRRRQQEEREREQERERKKREKEERQRKEREEREKKTREEKEARMAKEKEERAERERVEKERREERERVEKEKKLAKEKEEKEAKEKLATQQRAAAAAAQQKELEKAQAKQTRANANAIASSSTSSSTSPIKASSSSGLVVPIAVSSPALQRSPNNSISVNPNGIHNNNGKKPLNLKQPPTASMPGMPGMGQGPRPPMPQQQPLRAPHLPPTPINIGQHPPHLPPQQGMMFGHPQIPVGMMPPALSPRAGNFPPMPFPPFGGQNMSHHSPAPGTPHAPSMQRGFNPGPPFDSNFSRGVPMGVGMPLNSANNVSNGNNGHSNGPPAPIGPPKAKTPLAANPINSGPGMLAPGQGRRSSVPLPMSTPQPDLHAPNPGPITRPIGPIAPIARPTTATSGSNNDATNSPSAGSPSRRSPSPKGILGSSALAADDDEVVSGPRRVAAPIGMPMGVPVGASNSSGLSGMGGLNLSMVGGIGSGAPGSSISQSWGPASPRTAMGEIRTGPWGPPPPPGFASPGRPSMPTPIGTLPQQQQHGSVSASMWGNNQSLTGGSSGEWAQPGGFFPPGPGPFMHHGLAHNHGPNVNLNHAQGPPAAAAAGGSSSHGAS